jgi:glycosyltransferase involved in cell wall biosynthesis
LSEVRGRILFVSVHPPGHVPSQRYRFEQYEAWLAEHGLETTYSPVLRESEYEAMYRPGGVAQKGLATARGLLRRVRESLEVSDYDIVMVQREAVQLGTAAFEAVVGRSSSKLVFDFDDAIWLPDVSPANRRFAWLKRPEKVPKIISYSDMVLAGNDYLADYARKFNTNVRVLPTTIDTREYVPGPAPKDTSTVCIGWSGSVTTIKHFELAVPFLKAVRERFGDRVSFKVIGDPGYRNDELGIRGVPWRAETEVADLSELDIGIMPLPDEAWARGKCGLKGLQYMGLGIPPVMSPVGVNVQIVSDGVNGYLASSLDEWVGKLTALIESEEQRRRLGAAARQTVMDRYSVESQRDNYLALLTGLLSA